MPGQPNKRPAAVVLGIDVESASGRFGGEVVTLFVEPSTPASVNLKLVKSNAMELGGQLVTAEELPQLVGLQDGTAAYQLRFRLPKGVHGGVASLLIDGQPSSNGAFMPVALPLSFNGITSIAASGASLFVADTDAVYQVNWRDDVPTKTLRVSGRFYLSRTIQSRGSVMLVSAASGKPDILELPVSGPAGSSVFASTSSLSGDIRPVGMAVQTLGGAVYVADALSGNILLIPQGAQVAEDIRALLPTVAPETFYEPAAIDALRNSVAFSVVGSQPATTATKSVGIFGEPPTDIRTEKRVRLGLLVDQVVSANSTSDTIQFFVIDVVGPASVFNASTGIARAGVSKQRVELQEYSLLRPGPDRPERALTSNQPKLKAAVSVFRKRADGGRRYFSASAWVPGHHHAL